VTIGGLALALAALALAALALAPGRAEAQDGDAPRDETPRNVVFILSDDHRHDFMGFHEQAPDFLQTPGFDRMAREGMHLRNAFVTTSLCSPSRASILTGQYAHRHGVVDNSTRVPDGTTYFPERLQEAGYQTAFVGKWHMGRSSAEPRPGFDHWVSFRGQGEYDDPTLNVNGDEVEREGYITDLLTDYALDWLDERGGDGRGDDPFFLYLSHKAVHAQFRPAERHRTRYDSIDVPRPETMANTEANYRGKPDWVREQRYSWHGVEHMYHGRLEYEDFYQRYAETLLALDQSVSRVLDYLEAQGLAENTLVVYMGDNGFLLGEHGLIDKRHAYEPSIRVPMLAWAPGTIDGGTTAASLIRNIDIAPTVLDVARAAGGDEAALEMPGPVDGRSVLPVLRAEEMDEGGAFLYEYYWEYAFPHTPTTFALRGDRYKLIMYHGVWDQNELYDLQADPQERHNLIDVPALQDTVRSMQRRLFDRLEATGGMQIPLRPMGGFQAGERLRDAGSKPE
jgi:N-acetylglucosamine-6-sulfatase